MGYEHTHVSVNNTQININYVSVKNYVSVEYHQYRLYSPRIRGLVYSYYKNTVRHAEWCYHEKYRKHKI